MENEIKLELIDTKGKTAFDAVFQSARIDIIQTLIQAPNANAFSERWIRSTREECLDKLIIINQDHLRTVMCDFVNYYNMARPHQGIQQQTPLPVRRPIMDKFAVVMFLAVSFMTTIVRLLKINLP